VAEQALAVGREREFVLEAGRAIWSEATDVSRDPGLRVVCERAGLSWDDCAVAIDNELLLTRVQANTEALVRLGHWGVPVFVFETEMFWGQDRIGDLESTLQRVGLDR
jgi:2-hydroxychromene-2-carboxylate isomerase